MSNPYKRRISLNIFLSMLLLLQSCTVYKKAPISIDEAVALNRKVKVITVLDRELKFKRIEKNDTVYYGVKNVKGKIVKVPLNPDRIKTIKQPNRTASTLLNTTAITTSVLFIGYLIFQDSFKWNNSSDTSSTF